MLCIATDPLREPDSTIVRVLSNAQDAGQDAVPAVVAVDSSANAAKFTCAKEPCTGPNFMNGYEIVDSLDVKTLPAGKSYRLYFRSGISQADTTYVASEHTVV